MKTYYEKEQDALWEVFSKGLMSLNEYDQERKNLMWKYQDREESEDVWQNYSDSL